MIAFTCRPHRDTIPADRAGSHKLFVLLRLAVDDTAAHSPGNLATALAIAVDTSGSMFAKLPDGTAKIDRAIDGISALGRFPELTGENRLAIIQFDTDASTLLPLQTLGPDGAQRLDQVAQRLRSFSGGTNLARALRVILDALNQAPHESIRKALILTDGETTDEAQCRALTADFAQRGIGLICVGLGAEYNEDLLAELADLTNGFLYHLSETQASMARFETALRETLSRSSREVVTGVHLRLALGQGASLASINRVYPMVQALPTHEAGVYALGNLDRETETVVILELDLPQRAAGDFTVARVSVSSDGDPARAGQGDPQEARVVVRYSTAPPSPGAINPEVVFYVQQARVNAMADRAVRLTRQGRVAEARKSLAAVKDISEHIGNLALSRAAHRAIDELVTGANLHPETARAFKASAKTLTILSPPTRQQPSEDT